MSAGQCSSVVVFSLFALQPKHSLMGAVCAPCGSAKQSADGRDARAGVLIALNRFLQETHGSKMAFLDGSPPER